MIIPSIDLMSAKAVQLIGGEKKELDAGDPRPIAKQFALAGEIAVIDLDAALRQGSNTEIIKELLTIARCRVGGGIRNYQTAVEWLDFGADKIILGTAAEKELLARLPKERLIAALDARHGEVVVNGWRTGSGESVADRMQRLAGLVGGFLVTFVEREGRMAGFDMEEVKRLRGLAGDARLTIAGGITTSEEIAELDKLDVDAQVGMALYTGRLNLADAITAPLSSDCADGLWPTVVVDEHGVALGMAWSNIESVRQAVTDQAGVYHSRKRGMWVKGKTSGATQDLLRIDLDCDRDTLRFTVRQHGKGFCHTGTRTCWGDDRGIGRLERRLFDRLKSAPEGSYTKRLLDDPNMLQAKLLEEAKELTETTNRGETVHETADLFYFTLVKLISAGATLTDVADTLDKREMRLTRRPGNVKKQNAERLR